MKTLIVSGKQEATVITTEKMLEKFERGASIFFTITQQDKEQLFADLPIVEKTTGKLFKGLQSWLVKGTPIELHDSEPIGLVSLQIRLRADGRGVNMFFNEAREGAEVSHYYEKWDFMDIDEEGYSEFHFNMLSNFYSLFPTQEVIESAVANKLTDLIKR